MIKNVFEKLKKAKKAEDHRKLKAQLMDLLSGVETMEELKEVFAKDGAELSEPEAERLFQLLQHTRQLKKVTLDIDELTLVNGGGKFTPQDAFGPDGWLDKEDGVYRFRNKLYYRGRGFYIKALDGCAGPENGFCWFNDACDDSSNVYDAEYDGFYGDTRTDIDPARMSEAFINGEITGGEDF